MRVIGPQRASEGLIRTRKVLKYINKSKGAPDEKTDRRTDIMSFYFFSSNEDASLTRVESDSFSDA